ncbi:hypothetical protein FEP95_02481 [Burkholderia multivorans]|nr:hypothetical protein [Burkholderia multivorans]MDR8807416.1 hypothetical protein [Burkholderia multivorans]
MRLGRRVACLRMSVNDGIDMIKHIVMWDVRGETPEQKKETAQLVKTAFESLAGKIPGLRKLEVGMDFSKVDYACDVVLYTEFETVEHLEAYASHPEHLRVKQELGDCRISRHQVDYA